MTFEDLHTAVSAMVQSSRALAVPTTVKLEVAMDPIQLFWFLTTSVHVTRVETPEHIATTDAKGNVAVIRRGSVAYMDGI